MCVLHMLEWAALACAFKSSEWPEASIYPCILLRYVACCVMLCHHAAMILNDAWTTQQMFCDTFFGRCLQVQKVVNQWLVRPTPSGNKRILKRFGGWEGCYNTVLLALTGRPVDLEQVSETASPTSSSQNMLPLAVVL